MNQSLARFVPALAIVASTGIFVASPALARSERIRAEGPLIAYSSAIPAGAAARVQAVYDASGSAVVTLHVWGLAPNTEYGAHAHANPCGTTGASAGPHFQNVQDTVVPSVNPTFANPRNEVWLDLTTDAEGNGSAQTRVPRQFGAERRPHSVIIHVEHTHTGPTDSGIAGARLACLTVGF